MPDTLNYMIAGYVLTLLILGGFIGYLIVRQRQLHTERQELEALVDERTDTL
jgi:hypothetical protein